MEKLFREFMQGYTALGIAGLLAAIVLLLIIRMLLPRKDRRQLRVPIYFLFVHIGALAIELFAPDGSSLQRALAFIAMVALLFAVGRLAGLLVLEVILN